MSTIFIAYNHKDKVIARLVYQYLVAQYWTDVLIFLDEFSIQPGEDIHEKCISAAQQADLGLVILSEYTQKSEYVSQELGLLISRDIPKIYIAPHEEWTIPPGYASTTRSFPLYADPHPLNALSKLVELIASLISPAETGPVELVNNAWTLSTQGKLQEAVLTANAAVRIDPKYDEAYINKVGFLRKLKLYEEAFQTIEEGFKHLPGNVRLQVEKGFLLFCVGRYEEAVALFSVILEKTDSKDQFALYYKGRALERLGRNEEASELFKACYEMDATSNNGSRAVKLYATYSVSGVEDNPPEESNPHADSMA